MGFTAIEVERPEPALLSVTMTREKEMNTLSLELVREMGEVLAEAGADPNVRAIIVTGPTRSTR